jgi:hypothetical protein
LGKDAGLLCPVEQFSQRGRVSDRGNVIRADPQAPKDAERNRQTLAFFRWALANGQELAGSLDYVPLPVPLVQQVEAYWQAQVQ